MNPAKDSRAVSLWQRILATYQRYKKILLFTPENKDLINRMKSASPQPGFPDNIHKLHKAFVKSDIVK